MGKTIRKECKAYVKAEVKHLDKEALLITIRLNEGEMLNDIS